MGRLGEVLDFERTGSGPETKVDCGGGEIFTASHFDSAGCDAPPLPGDTAALEDSTGTGAQQVSGYLDPLDANGKAEPGEYRVYARNAAGVVVCEVYLQSDGTILFENAVGSGKLNPDGSAEINGATITITGDVQTASGVSLQNHLHPSPTGPTGPPTPTA
jgi:hypothetical protein